MSLKRLFDILVSSVLLVITLPADLALAIVIRISLGRPVFFLQERPGYRGKPFILIKFRTMSHTTNEDGTLLPDADRLGTVGRVLRKTSLDELPELFNVLRGDMSMVGPRPLLMSYLDKYSPEQARRHEVRPGITGWAQINGRNAGSWADRFRLDVWYVDHHSFSLDLKILWRTVWLVLSGRGVSEPGQATRGLFTGTAEKE